MSRRILTGAAAGAPVGAPQAPPTIDDYVTRLMKYIPSEIVGLYLAMRAVVPADGKHYPALWAVFAISAVLVPIYIWAATRRETDQKPLWIQVLLATIAFPVWAFAIGEPFSHLTWYQGWVATLLLIFITVVFAMVKPVAGT